MHVAAVIANFDPESGGAYTFEGEILSSLKAAAERSNHRFTVLCAEQALQPVSNALRGSRLNVSAVPRRAGRLERVALRELEVVRAHWRRPSDIDRVAARNGIEFIWFLGALPDRTDLPYMTVVWDVQHRATPWFPELSAKGTWDTREAYHRWFLQRATRVVTGTQVGRDQLAHFYQIDPSNILILPHPTPSIVADEANAPGGSVASRFGLPQPFVLYPAQFWPHKNHANLLMAVASLARRGHRIGLALPGSDKGNRTYIEALAAREGIQDLVRFLGFIDRSDLVALYREAAALAYVSWCGPENFPPLEAFALGCPVVASRIPGSDEQLGEAAQFCQPGDPEDIARAILDVVQDADLRRRMIADGQRRAMRFTPADYVQGVLAFLDEFAAVRRCWP